MAVKVFLSSTLRQHIPGYVPSDGAEITLDRKITVSELCTLMGIPLDMIKVIMVNGRDASLDDELRGDERVGLFPPLGGG
ncbi:MAG: MoaD/ThiS family protein [Deltaproteobacteria bacterium]|jgi:hypothetical protein|nr:MoaD/ThiS family protein [Deltaproteobacteria bacterium]